ncbi:hypothetical protein HA397_26625, partial [Escherichia coli]|nr:hypothetical protein [Escherichia coli]
QTQRMSMTPGLRQGMSLLQLSTVAVWAEIARVAAENPLLDYTEGGERQLPDFDTATRTISESQTLAQNLTKQITLMDLPKQVSLLAQYLAADLTEDGYLEHGDEDISDMLDLSLVTVERAIDALQACEPTGIAARNLGECLALQLIEKGVPGQAAHLACQHLDLLVEQQWRRAHRETGLAIEALQDIAQLLPGLNPHPGRDYAPLAAPMIPELEVELDRGGNLNIVLIRDVQPRLQIDDQLLA